MTESYAVFYENNAVGTARAEKQGLYMVFSCRCRTPDHEMYRIHAICGENREDLGICIPMGDGFGVDKRIPAKRLSEEALTFELVPKDWTPPAAIEEPTAEEPSIIAQEEFLETATEELLESAEQFIPVSEDEPFEALDELENAHMEIRNDTPGIVIEPGTEA